MCGSICPQDRLCEGNCVIEQSGHGTVTIGAVEKFITNTAWDNGWIKPIVPLTEVKTICWYYWIWSSWNSCSDGTKKRRLPSYHL